MEESIENYIHSQYFNTRVKIEKEFVVGNPEERYVNQILYQGTKYILKGFKIQLEHLNPEEKESAESFRLSLIQISEVFQEFYFARAASSINHHIAVPLSLDYMIELAKDKASFSYMHIQIVFEYGGISLNNLQPTTIKQTYNLMRQSASALSMLHNLGIAHFDIKPANMVYDSKKDLLKIVDMGSAFGCSNRNRLSATTVNLDGKVRSATPEFAPPEVVLMERELSKNLELSLSLPAIDVYCWAMTFFTTLTDKKNIDLRKYFTKYKAGSEKDYNGFMKVVEISFGTVKPKNSKEEELMTVITNLLTRALQYKPKERPIIKDAIREMKEFERDKKYTLDYSNTKLEHNKSILKLLMDEDIDCSLNADNEEEIKAKSPVVDDIPDKSVKLSCNHGVSKDQVKSVEKLSKKYKDELKKVQGIFNT